MYKILRLIIAFGFFLSLFSCTDKKENANQLIPVNTEKGYQYVNTKGEIIIKAQFTDASLFHDGLALVQTTVEGLKNWGYINEKGEYVITPNYEQATLFNEGFAWMVANDSAPHVINTKGEILFSIEDVQRARNFSQGLAAVQVADSMSLQWGYVNTKGEFSICPQFQEAYPFKNGIAMVKKDDKYGFINLKGEISIPTQYSESDFSAYCRETQACKISPYTEVETDYFDKEEILDILRSVLTNANDHRIFETTFADLIKEYGINQDVFSKFTDENRIAHISVSQVFGYDIYVLGQAWKALGKDTYEFLPTAKIEAFSIYVQLTKGGAGKASQIFDAFDTAFAGYTQDKVESTDVTHVFTNGKQKISIWMIYGSSFVVKMEPIKP